jgi:YVTN family beta-propeller protein
MNRAHVIVGLALCASCSTSPVIEQPGPRDDGSILLPSGWSLRPHGRQVELPSDLPVRMALHPDGRLVAVQHAGYRAHTVTLVDLERLEAQGADGDPAVALTSSPIAKSWSGLCWSADGTHLFVSGGVEDCVHVLTLDPQRAALTATGRWPVGDGAVLDLVAGMCPGENETLWVCLQRSSRVVRLSRDGTVEVAIALPGDSMPFECLRSANDLWVSLWGAGEVWALDPRTGDVRARVATGQHPSQLLLAPDGARLFVSNSNENTVSVVDVVRARVEETLVSSLTPDAPPGSTPNALALDASGAKLLVANADNNDLAVIDVSERGHARPLGFVPVGAYPTAVLVDGDERVVVANGKGSVGSRANPGGPQPAPGKESAGLDYVGALFGSSLALFPMPEGEDLERLSARALAGAPGPRRPRATARPRGSPVPARVGETSPIRHCVYVIKENRTYDQVFGDVPEGDGDPELCLFPEIVTPNHHAIAREFVLLDNVYVEAEVSADGHEWTMGAYASDFVERTWPVTYGGKGSTTLTDGRRANLGYPSEGNFDIATPRNGYLFDLAARAGLAYRSYGEFVDGGGDEAGEATIDVLEGHFDPAFRGWDMSYRDVDRAQRFLEELAEYERQGDYPNLVVVRLPNDHTTGTSAGTPTPRAHVADNDLALGRVLEGLSRSSFWESMAVFVIEDDAQNGPDHVDAHRTVALVAGPWVKRGEVVHTMYSTSSLLRTIELLLGLPPMSQFDAAALPMVDCFTSTPDTRPYTCRPATWPLDERNAATAWGSERSERFDFSREDAADDLALMEVVWKAVRGADSPCPPPRRAAFVRALEENEDDD